MPDNKAILSVRFGDGTTEQWTPDQYEQVKDKLYQADPKAKVVRSGVYNPEEGINNNDAFDIQFSDGATERWNGEQLGQVYDKLMQADPKAQIIRHSDLTTQYWKPKEDEAKARLDEFDALNREFINDFDARREKASASMSGTLSPEYKAFVDANGAKYDDLIRQREELRRDYYSNPLVMERYENNALGAADRRDEYEERAKNAADRAERKDWQRAAKLEDDIRKMYEAPNKYDEEIDKDNGFAKYLQDYKQGAWDKFSDKDYYTFGLSNIARNFDLRGIAEKVQNAGSEADIDQILTDSEKAQLNAFYNLAEAQMERADNISGGYTAGQTAAESTKFMAEFLLSQGFANIAGKALSSSTNAVASWLGRQLMSNQALASAAAEKTAQGARIAAGVAREAGKAAPVRFASQVISKPVIQGLWHTGTQLSTLEAISDNMMKTDSERELISKGQAIGTAVMDQIIENWSESLGGAVEGRLAPKFEGKTQFGRFARWLNESAPAKVLGEAGFNGLLGEIGEEWAGNAVRLGTGLMSKEEFKDFASLEQQLEMAASFAPMSLIGIGTASAAAIRNARDYKDLSGKVADIMKRQGKEGEIENLLNTKYDTPEDIGKKLAPILSEISKKAQEEGATDEIKADYKTMLDFATILGKQAVLDEQQRLEQEGKRNQIRDDIQGRVGRFWEEGDETVPEDQRHVRIVTDAEGNRIYVTASDEKGVTGVSVEDGKPRIVDADQIQEDTTLPMAEYLQQQSDLRDQDTERQRMEQETAEQLNAVMQRVQPNTIIPMGTESEPVNATVMATDKNGAVLRWQTADGQVKEEMKPWSEIASLIGTPITVKTDAELAQDAAEAMEKANARAQTFNKVPAGTTMVVNLEEVGPVNLKFQKAVVDDGQVLVYGIDEDGNSQPYAESDIANLEEMLAAPVEEKAESNPYAAGEQITYMDEAGNTHKGKVAEADNGGGYTTVELENGATATVRTDRLAIDNEVPRDSRGKAMPTRINKETGQTEVDSDLLWKDDPQAWVEWNDSNPDSTVSSDKKLSFNINALNGRINDNAARMEDMELRGGHQDEVDAIREEQKTLTERRDQLQSLLDSRVAAVANAAAAESEVTPMNEGTMTASPEAVQTAMRDILTRKGRADGDLRESANRLPDKWHEYLYLAVKSSNASEREAALADLIRISNENRGNAAADAVIAATQSQSASLSATAQQAPVAYEQGTPQATYSDIYSNEAFETAEEADGFVQGRIATATAEVQKAQKAYDKVQADNKAGKYASPAEFAQAKAQAQQNLAAAQSNLDHWNGVKAIADNAVAEAQKAAEAEEQMRMSRESEEITRELEAIEIPQDESMIPDFRDRLQALFARAGQAADKANILRKLYDAISGGERVVVLTRANALEVAANEGFTPNALGKLKAELDRTAASTTENTRAFAYQGKTFIVADDIVDIENGRTAFVHERQHKITDNKGYIASMMTYGIPREKWQKWVEKMSGSRAYEKDPTTSLMHEALSMAMEIAYSNEAEDVEQKLRDKGIDNEDFINFIKTIDNEQRNDQSLRLGRRTLRGGQHQVSNLSDEGSVRQDGGNQRSGAGEVAVPVDGAGTPGGGRGEGIALSRTGQEPGAIADSESILAEEGIAANGDEARFSIRYVPAEDKRGQIVDAIAANVGVSREKAQQYLDSETSIAAIYLDEATSESLNYEADDRYTAIKKNSDYPQGTVDFNNICRKRKQFTKVFTRLQKDFPNKVITGENLATIRRIMNDHGMDVACGLCYVEDRRQLLGEIAQSFINEVQGGFSNYASGGEAKAKNAEKFRDLLGSDTKEDLSIYDLITLEGSTALSKEHPGIYAAFTAYNAARGQQSGNLFQGYAEYKREILDWSQKKVDDVNANGGLRIFSYSDFEVPHLLDLIQIIQDCAVKGVMIQGYTKVPAFARAVAKTGIKMNRSLIPLGDTGIVDGKLAFDMVEGIDVNDPNFIEDNDNVGNVLVGINDEQIRLAMADPFIHYIIPYHSNQSMALRRAKNTGSWVNYKNEQTDKGENAGKHGINIYTDVLAAAEAEGKPIKTERQFVNKFLAVCKERGVTPRFERFLNRSKKGEYTYTPGYSKLLVDFKLFDSKGKILPQKPVVPEFDDEFNRQLLVDYARGEKEEQARKDEAIDAIYGEMVDALQFSRTAEPQAVDNVMAYINGTQAEDEMQRRQTEELFARAKERFGTTEDIREAGYVLPDGSMLDFSGRHWMEPGSDTSYLAGDRQVDHRDIQDLNYERDMNTPSGIETSMSDFIDRGAIRIHNGSGAAINLAQKPTAAQQARLRRLIDMNNGDVWVDFGNGDRSDHYVEYGAAKSARVLNDINRYFDEGYKPEGTLRFSLRGEKGAQTAQDAQALANLVVAEQMEEQGKDGKTIWLSTGWERGKDGEWRNEIPDGMPMVIKNTKNATVKDVIIAPELLESYPQLADINVKFNKSRTYSGSYDRNTNTIGMHTDNLDEDAYTGKPYLSEEGMSTIMHELQHVIQSIEGFARGGNPIQERNEYLKEMAVDLPELVTFSEIFSRANPQQKLIRAGRQKVADLARKNAPGAALDLDGLANRLDAIDDQDYAMMVREGARLQNLARQHGESRYERLAGEVESRNVQKRMGMSDASKSQTPPSETEDIKREDQGVRFSRAQEANKVPGQQYPTDADLMEDELRFSLSKNNRKTIEAWMNKRQDLSEDERKAVVDYIDGLPDAKTQLATGKWFAQGAIRLPEDMDKVEQAVSVAGKAKVDPLQYDSPMALLDAHADFKPTEKRINPDDVPTLHRAKEYPEYGVVVYDVDESDESRQNMRKIINTHFGKEASPWCLLQGDGNGKLTSNSAHYWRHYDAYPKQVAFKDGKLVAFSANDSKRVAWWDRKDKSHDGIPISMRIPNDELGRSATYELYKDGKVSMPREMYRGNKQDGVYETWYNGGQPKTYETYKDGKLNGDYKQYHSDGTIWEQGAYSDGRRVGRWERFHYTKSGKQKKEEVSNYNERGDLDGLYTHWYSSGKKAEEVFYQNGLRQGRGREWYRDGSLQSDFIYKDDKLVEGESYWEFGNIRTRKKGDIYERYSEGPMSELVERVEYYPGSDDIKISRIYKYKRIQESRYTKSDKKGLHRELDTDGHLLEQYRSYYGLTEGLYEAFDANGTLRERANHHNGRATGIMENYDENGNLVRREEVINLFNSRELPLSGKSPYGPTRTAEEAKADMEAEWNAIGGEDEETPQFSRSADLTDAQKKVLAFINGEREQATTEGEVLAENLRFSRVTDPKLLEELEKGKTFKAYRAMALIDGKLYSPMATQIRDEKGRWTLRQPTELGEWEQSDEHPEKAVEKNGKWVYRLKKPDGTAVDAAYNPYIHTSLIPLNDQFTAAHKRPELVTVEVEVPESELTSGYKAEKAKDAVGKMAWHAGPVAGQLPEGSKREVVLSRYDKPVRIVPDSEVADKIVEAFKGVETEPFPWNVFTPSLREELRKRGVQFSDEAAGTVSREDQDAYKEWKKGQAEDVRFSRLAPNGKPSNLTDEQWEMVRTPQFKRWFGDWEKGTRVEKLRNSKPIIRTGKEWEGKYELNNRSADKYIKENLRGDYINSDTGDNIKITRRGAEKVTRHDAGSDIHLKSIAYIPDMIKQSIFIAEEENEKKVNGFDSYRYYVVGLKIGGIDYTAKLVVGVKGKDIYYDHALTQIEKTNLLDDIDEIKRSYDKEELLSKIKDKRLLSILQTNSSKVLDENGEPMVMYHGTIRAGFNIFKNRNGKNTIGWFTSSKKDADSYAGNPKGKEYIPGEKEEQVVLKAGTFPLNDHMVFDSQEDLDDFVKRFPNAKDHMTREQIDEAINNAESDKEEAELREKRKEYDKIATAYGEYENDHLVNTTIGDLIDNPDAYTTNDFKRAMYAYDSNAYLDDIEELDEEGQRREMLDALQYFDEESAEDGGIRSIVFGSRVPRGGEGVKVSDLNRRTYATFINIKNPFVINAKGKHSELESGDIYQAIDMAMEDDRYDGVIVNNWRVGRYQQLGTVAIPKQSDQIKLANTEVRDNDGNVIPLSERFNPENEDIRFSRAAQAVEQADEGGIQAVVGSDNAKDFAADIYRAMPAEMRRTAVDKAMGGDLNIHKALVDDLSRIAYEGYENDEAGILRAAGKILSYYAGENLDEATVRYILWRNGQPNDLLTDAQAAALKKRWGVGEDLRFSREMKEDVDAADNAAEATVDEAAKALSDGKRDLKDMLTATRAMRLQKEYDKKTIEAVTNLAKQLLKDQYVSEMSRRDIARLLGLVRTSAGRSPRIVKRNADTIVEIVIDNLLKKEKAAYEAMTKKSGTKTNATGVEVQGELDLQGQKTLKAYKEGLKLKVGNVDDSDNENTLYGMKAKVQSRLNSKDDAVRAEAEAEDAGLTMAIEYQEGIAELLGEEKGLEAALDDLKAALAEGEITKKAYDEAVESTNDAIRANHIDQVEAYRDFATKMRAMLSQSREDRAAFVQEEKDRVNEIHHLANSDMQGKSASRDKRPTFTDKLANNPIARFAMAPLATFDQMLRLFGEKSINGEGYLWNRFMSKWQKATENEYIGQRDAKEKLDKKVSEVFGKKMIWSDLYDVERKMPKVTARWWDDGEMKDHELTQGQLLYIYMVNKMADGRMKLRRMGIEQEHVDAIVRQMDERFLTLADWLQEEFLVDLRNKYNAVHERLFGASMAAIDDYFPLVINKRDLERNEDVGLDTDFDSLPSTTTGSIIKRKRNNKALDLMNADAFSVVIDHIDQMEKWAAFAEFNKDVNALLSYKRFRNQVQNMASVYGSGTKLWDNFKSVAKIAAGSYKPKRSNLDKDMVNIAKGVTAAKISFRVYTALKQTLSSPAFLADASMPNLAKSLATAGKSWAWAMENLPIFEKRWKSRIAGDTRLMQTDLDWNFYRQKLYDKASKLGMSPNAFVDAVTVAVGAKAIYDTKYAQFKSEGFSDEDADRKAKTAATVLVNETQQSSEGAFVSPVQLDRTVLATMITVFRNSSMGFQRQVHDSLRNLGKHLKPGYKEQSMEYTKKQLMRDGLTEEQAEQAAKKRYNKSFVRDATRLAVFGFLVEFSWNLGSYIAYLLFGDDDDKKKEMLADAARHAMFGGLIEGLAGGNVVSEGLNTVAQGESLWNYDPQLLPLFADIKSAYSKMSSDPVSGWNDVVNLAIQAGVGVNPQTLTDAVVAVADACDGDLETSKEAMLLIMRVLQVPQSQVDELYIDELGTTARGAQKMSYSQMAQRYADYKIAREAPLTGWAYSDEARKKREKSKKTTFKKKVNERKK